MAGLPTGTVTFLFTDIEGSTRLVQDLGDTRSGQVFDDHRRLLLNAIQAASGTVYEDQGESFLFVFPSAKNAVLAAVTAQRALAAHSWPGGVVLRVRMGLHAGEPVRTGSGYVGIDVHGVARVCHAGHGGQILLTDAVRGLVANGLPDGVTLRDMGEHRLKDFARPHRLYQAIIPDLPADFPPLRSLNLLPNNLPLQLTSFIGREREIEEVKQLLLATRLLTLTGIGGVGKTRLALQVAAQVLGEFNDGVWLTELARLSDPALILQTVATVLGVREQPGRSIAATIIDFLRHRHLLLLLDNVEHLVAACAEHADNLLRECPNLRILATGREALAIVGEAVWRVLPLSVPDLKRPQSVDGLLEFEAVRLLVDRAKAVLPTFTLTNQNATAVAGVCRQLDGIALAIELAAARVKVLAIEQIAARLDDRFRLLTEGSRVVPPRHQTLRAAIDWSYELLSEKEQSLLRRLSVFAGGCTLDSAETVCTGEALEAHEVLDLLAQLANKSLVTVETQGGEARYTLLQMVRQYAQVKLGESGETAAVQSRHRDWYLKLAERVEPELRGQSVWLARLEAEHDNLRAALEWSRREKGGSEAGLRLAGALQWFWYEHGHWSEGRRWLEDALARSGDAPRPVLSKALRGAAWLAWRQGDYERAITLGDQGLAVCRELGDKEGTAWFLIELGIVAIYQGDYERATALFEEGLTLRRELGDKWAISVALAQLGAAARHRGDYERAAAFYAESHALSREVGNKGLIAYSLRNLGIVSLEQGDDRHAAACYAQSLALCKELGDRWETEECLEGLAGVACVQGRYKHAAWLFGAAEALREALGFRPSPADQAAHNQRVPATRAGLGDEAFTVALAEGRAMTLEQAVELALRGET